MWSRAGLGRFSKGHRKKSPIVHDLFLLGTSILPVQIVPRLRRTLLICAELIASIEINSIWGNKHCLCIVKPSVEYTAEFRLWLWKWLKAKHMFQGCLKIPQPMGYVWQHERVLYNPWMQKRNFLKFLKAWNFSHAYCAQTCYSGFCRVILDLSQNRLSWKEPLKAI